MSYVVFFDNFGHFGQQDGGENVSGLSLSSLAILCGFAPQISIPSPPQNRVVIAKILWHQVALGYFIMKQKEKIKYVIFTFRLKTSLFLNKSQDPLLSFYLSCICAIFC